jgi:orotidine-5'-phosphate decarboxylase
MVYDMPTTEASDRLILALDLPAVEPADTLIDEMEGLVSFYKVGQQLFTAAGPQFVTSLVQRNKKVFLDLKWIDIPQTVGLAVRAAANLGAHFATVDGNGCGLTLAAAVKARDEARQAGEGDIRLLLVTALTHLDDRETGQMYGKTVNELVRHRAQNALEAGFDGVICSGHEVSIVRGIANESGNEAFLIVTPGIRFPESDADDHQNRACDPKTAIANGATHLVVGRPIRNAGGRDEKRASAQRFIQAIEDGLPVKV